ncbi:hypothetical protein ABZ924_12140 [Streptomyces sp. NPDC046876]|uniref:hypothetical protein n=1 Tax=Streptomyces sp. NPDC046876 TaxID=3155616 RepID=UPI0033F06F07
MWPGQQQPPGGQQNPQDAHQNPYQQQPGQPNPYQQQPGYGYPQAGYPTQPQPAAQQWTQPQQAVPAPPNGGGGGGLSTKTVAIVAASAVVVAAAATGAFVLTRDDKKNDVAENKPAASASASTPESAAPSASGANPRAGGDIQPVIPGWKVVVNPKYGTAFDVPPEWNVSNPGVIASFTDDVKNDGKPIIGFSAPAFLKEDWCKIDSNKDGREEKTELAGTGTKGGQGAKDTAEAVKNEAGNWAFAAFAQKAPKGTVKVSEPKEYTTSSGLKGHMATATALGVPKENKCSRDGKTIAFSFKTANGDFSSWVLFTAAGVEGEVTQETMDKILSSVRLNGVGTG